MAVLPNENEKHLQDWQVVMQLNYLPTFNAWYPRKRKVHLRLIKKVHCVCYQMPLASGGSSCIHFSNTLDGVLPGQTGSAQFHSHKHVQQNI